MSLRTEHDLLPMLSLDPDALSELGEIFLLANTPGFLVAHFLAAEGVRQLQHHTNTDLAEAFEISLNGAPTVANVAFAYGCLVALLVRLREMNEPLQPPVDYKVLDWGSAIVAYARASVRFTTTNLIAFETSRVSGEILVDAVRNPREIFPRPALLGPSGLPLPTSYAVDTPTDTKSIRLSRASEGDQ